MSSAYRAVNWNRQKFIYDGLLAAGVLLYLGLFIGVTFLVRPEATLETALIRALGTGALVLLHLILVIGPLARLDDRFAPLLYNRRHLGVTMFLLALGHAAVSLVQFHALGDVNPFVSLLTAAGDWTTAARFPFELPGLVALVILFLMAATSHDFWLALLPAPAWKALHMLVYPAYALLVLHVALGTLQSESSPVPAILLGIGLLTVFGLHLLAGWRERAGDRPAPAGGQAWVAVCRVDEVREGRGKMAVVGAERVAVFRHGGRISCVSNVCQHQNGPLAEGRIVDGCITCPWHGYQYRPDDGTSPPPFTERIPTFNVRIDRGQVLVDPRPNAPGTRVEPAVIEPPATAVAEPAGESGFFVGYHPALPLRYARLVRGSAVAILAGVMVVAVLLGASQDPMGQGLFEYGTLREFSGTLVSRPYPMLLVARPGRTDRDAAYSRYLLVGRGKHGAQSLVAGHDGEHVRTSGTIINREGSMMLELLSVGSFPGAAPAPGPPAAPVELGYRTIRGEILDSKCWLGVMKPASGTVHRGCATRCLSGGIPPLVIVDDPDLPSRQVLLLDRNGAPAGAWFKQHVGGTVTLRGDLELRGELVVMRVREIS